MGLDTGEAGLVDGVMGVLARHGVRVSPGGRIEVVGPGWIQLLDSLILDLRSSSWNGALDGLSVSHGRLRLYLSGPIPEGMAALMASRLRQAEDHSAVTCDVCGHRGVLRVVADTYQVRCDQHIRSGPV